VPFKVKPIESKKRFELFQGVKVFYGDKNW
jgi:hypothetical protein